MQSIGNNSRKTSVKFLNNNSVSFDGASESKHQRPVLIVGYNRPDMLRQILPKLDRVPKSLTYFWIDGPKNNDSDVKKNLDIRAILASWDPLGRATKQFLPGNLGCRKSVSSAIAWFFSHVDAGIVLEDDCQPEPGFFEYMDYMLEKYSGDQTVALISGSNPIEMHPQEATGHSLSKYPLIWGWASWRHVFDDYDPSMSSWKTTRGFFWLLNHVGLKLDAALFWWNRFNQVARHSFDTWDYQLTFLFFEKSLKAIVPSHNLVSNLGFGPESTHSHANRYRPPRKVRSKLLNYFANQRSLPRANNMFDRRLELEFFRTRRGMSELFSIGFLMLRRLLKRSRPKIRC